MLQLRPCSQPGCAFVYKQPSRLRAHLVTQHSLNHYRHYCDKCERNYARRDDLLRHTRQHHDGEPTFVDCSDCAQLFKERRSMLRHQRRHQREACKGLPAQFIGSQTSEPYADTPGHLSRCDMLLQHYLCGSDGIYEPQKMSSNQPDVLADCSMDLKDIDEWIISEQASLTGTTSPPKKKRISWKVGRHRQQQRQNYKTMAQHRTQARERSSRARNFLHATISYNFSLDECEYIGDGLHWATYFLQTLRAGSHSSAEPDFLERCKVFVLGAHGALLNTYGRLLHKFGFCDITHDCLRRLLAAD